jgi:hypothetical protein
MSTFSKVNHLFFFRSSQNTQVDHIFDLETDDKYWRFNKNLGLYRNYPKPISTWGELPSKIDGIVDYDDETIYLIRNDLYWSFDEIMNRVGHNLIVLLLTLTYFVLPP